MILCSCILIEDEPLAITQIISCINRQKGIILVAVYNDMDAFFASISDKNMPDILILDYLIPSQTNIYDILTILPKTCSIALTSVIPIAAYPEFRKKMGEYNYYELCKPFSNEKFNDYLNKVISRNNL